jgi:hypothetical protein
MAQERVGQVRRPSDPLDALMGLVDHLGQGGTGEVGQLHGLEAGPQALDRVELAHDQGQVDQDHSDCHRGHRLGRPAENPSRGTSRSARATAAAAGRHANGEVRRVTIARGRCRVRL